MQRRNQGETEHSQRASLRNAAHFVEAVVREQLQDLFNSEVLIPAKALISLPGIRHMPGKQMIAWFHFVYKDHQVVFANGFGQPKRCESPRNGKSRQKISAIDGSGPHRQDTSIQ